MTIERVALTDERSPAWQRARLTLANASEMGIICEACPWGSRATLFAEKKGLRPPSISKGLANRGLWGEAAAAQALCQERPHWTIARAMIHVVDVERRIAATPDAFVERPDRPGTGVLQIKTVPPTIFRNDWLNDSATSIEFGEATVPMHYRLQVATELMLCSDRCEWACLAALITGEFEWHLRIFDDIERDPVLEDMIILKSAEFLGYLDRNEMPPFNPERDGGLIADLYPRDDGGTIDLSADNRAVQATEEWLEAAAARKRSESLEKELRTELAAKIGPHTFARLADGRRLSYKVQHRKAHAVEASDFRVLRIQKGGAA